MLTELQETKRQALEQLALSVNSERQRYENRAISLPQFVHAINRYLMEIAKFDGRKQ